MTAMRACPSRAYPWMAHPVFHPVRKPLERVLRGGDWPEPAALNQAAEKLGVELVTAAGRPIRFVPSVPDSRNYELKIFETGLVATRRGNWHDLFNALAWMAFPRTKSALNALHAEAIPGEQGQRSRLRDLLTLFDEGGAVVAVRDPALEALIRGFRWQELFWTRRASALGNMRILVLGHAVLEMARSPWPGVTCKVLFMPATGPLAMEGETLLRQADAHAAGWLWSKARYATPRDLPSLPIFGYPDWLPQSEHPSFYEDTRYFRPFRREPAREPAALESGRESARQPL